ncbi:MAG: hypothetical protein RR933_08410 [Oscillospiraceae bacterium]
MNKINCKNILWALIAFIALGASYLVFRFGMFDLHGMKQLPTILCLVSLAVLILSLILKKHWLAASTDLGYIGGFVVALLLNSDSVDAGGAATNNLWIIWTAILLACIAAGIVIEIALNRNRFNK